MKLKTAMKKELTAQLSQMKKERKENKQLQKNTYDNIIRSQIISGKHVSEYTVDYVQRLAYTQAPTSKYTEANAYIHIALNYLLLDKINYSDIKDMDTDSYMNVDYEEKGYHK